MLQENFERTLRAMCRRTPFKSFEVELNSDGRIEVDHPEALNFRGGLAVYISAEGVPTLFDHHSVSRLIGATGEAANA